LRGDVALSLPFGRNKRRQWPAKKRHKAKAEISRFSLLGLHDPAMVSYEPQKGG
jgi:hypothetical protein